MPRLAHADYSELMCLKCSRVVGVRTTKREISVKWSITVTSQNRTVFTASHSNAQGFLVQCMHYFHPQSYVHAALLVVRCAEIRKISSLSIGRIFFCLIKRWISNSILRKQPTPMRGKYSFIMKNQNFRKIERIVAIVFAALDRVRRIQSASFCIQDCS